MKSWTPCVQEVRPCSVDADADVGERLKLGSIGVEIELRCPFPGQVAGEGAGGTRRPVGQWWSYGESRLRLREASDQILPDGCVQRGRERLRPDWSFITSATYGGRDVHPVHASGRLLRLSRFPFRSGGSPRAARAPRPPGASRRPASCRVGLRRRRRHRAASARMPVPSVVAKTEKPPHRRRSRTGCDALIAC